MEDQRLEAAIPAVIVQGQFAWRGTESAPEQSVGHWKLLIIAPDADDAMHRAEEYWAAEQRRVTKLVTTNVTLQTGLIIDLSGRDFLPRSGAFTAPGIGPLP